MKSTLRSTASLTPITLIAVPQTDGPEVFPTQVAAAYDPLLPARTAAERAGRALSTFYRDVASGALPAGMRIGPRMVRWRASVIDKAVEDAARRNAA